MVISDCLFINNIIRPQLNGNVASLLNVALKIVNKLNQLLIEIHKKNGENTLS